MEQRGTAARDGSEKAAAEGCGGGRFLKLVADRGR